MGKTGQVGRRRERERRHVLLLTQFPTITVIPQSQFFTNKPSETLMWPKLTILCMFSTTFDASWTSPKLYQFLSYYKLSGRTWRNFNKKQNYDTITPIIVQICVFLSKVKSKRCSSTSKQYCLLFQHQSENVQYEAVYWVFYHCNIIWFLDVNVCYSPVLKHIPSWTQPKLWKGFVHILVFWLDFFICWYILGVTSMSKTHP